MGLYKNNSGTLAPIAGTPSNVISGLQNSIDQIANNTTKNLLPNKASSYHTNPRTINGVTFTINDDGSVTTSGTNTGGGDINYAINADILFLNDCGPYILSGFPSGLSDNSYLGIYNPNIAWYASSKSNPEVTVDATLETGSYVCILLRSTYTGTYTWKPMIRPVGVDDNTYQPYAMTNRELTEHHTTVAKTFTQSSTDVATYLRNANTSGYIAFGYSYNRTMITVNAIFTIKASGNALYKSDGTTATSGNENWELIKIPNFPYSKAIPDGPLSGLLFLNTTDLKDLYCRKSGNDLIFTISATDYANFVGKGIRLSATIMLE